MDSFRFSPELFEVRTDVISLLADNDFLWLSDFGSVDTMHDVYGIEVCGIHHESDAREILQLLCRQFPTWPDRACYFKDFGREIGWKARISRDGPDPHRSLPN